MKLEIQSGTTLADVSKAATSVHQDFRTQLYKRGSPASQASGLDYDIQSDRTDDRRRPRGETISAEYASARFTKASRTAPAQLGTPCMCHGVLTRIG